MSAFKEFCVLFPPSLIIPCGLFCPDLLGFGIIAALIYHVALIALKKDKLFLSIYAIGNLGAIFQLTFTLAAI
jgi:hypothetical protein